MSLFWQKTPRILIIHSYNLDYIWTADLDKALHQILDNKPLATNKQNKITKRQMTELDLSAIYDAYALLGK